MAPVCSRCALCGLNAETNNDGVPGVHELEICYGGSKSSELAPLWRRHFVCVSCIAALTAAQSE